MGTGLGDLLLVTVFPLAMRKAFGRSAGIVAMAVGLAAIGTMLALLDLDILHTTLPAMVVIGPLMALQYACWFVYQGRERTTLHYLKAEPLHASDAG